MKHTIYRTASAVLFLLLSVVGVSAQPARNESTPNPLIRIIRYEDQRNWNDDLKMLLSESDPMVRKRAALAAGRIGDVRAIPTLADMLLMDRDKDVRQMVAFALGEIESTGGAFALTEVLKDRRGDLVDANVRARAVEALGKIVAATAANNPAASADLNTPEGDRLDLIKAAILDTLRFDEQDRRSRPDRLTILLALTAVLRSRPEGTGVGPLVAKFLDYPDSEIVATALNTMARLRLKDANEQVRKLLNHSDPIVRANAARVIGAAEHKEAFDAVLDRALKDPDIRVRASAIRALGSLKDKRAADPLLDRGTMIWKSVKSNLNGNDNGRSEILEIAASLGRVLPLSNSQRAMEWLDDLRESIAPTPPEVEVAYAQIAPQFYMIRTDWPLRNSTGNSKLTLAKTQSAMAQGITELAAVKTNQPILDANIREIGTNDARSLLMCQPFKPPARPMKVRRGSTVTLGASCTPLQTLAIPDSLKAYASFKPNDLGDVLKERLSDTDVIVRATAAELLGDQPPSEANTHVLIEALPRALRDRDLNDAALAILDALGKQKNQAANDAIKKALNSDDHLIRRKAVAVLKANGVGDFSDRIGLVKTRYSDIDYRRAMARIGQHPTATVITSRGSFTIEFLPADAPLNVDNFIQLAKRGYFNGQTIPRVVPNFVVQAGDPRGDQNGGPGYQIRCEINEIPYQRATVGMALSGKDTGGSQWFVTHSPQQHLDGGYTVFGRVIRGMDVIDNIARGDVIRRVVVNER
jgi:cyclophilin family peptidyl-prolyl cis-trans isomerase/HEAT repeat protein